MFSSELFILLTMNWSRMLFACVYVIGIVLSLTHWKRQPAISLLAFSGFTMFLIQTCLGAFTSYLIAYRTSLQIDTQSTTRIIGVVSLAATVFDLIGWGLIIAALFMKRPSAET